MSSILINQIWQHKKAEYRILYIDQEIDLLVWFRRDQDNTFPEEIPLTEFEQLVEINLVKELNIQDTFVDIKSLDGKTLTKYEKSWEIIKDLVRDEPLIFDRKYFNLKSNELAKLHGVSRHSIHRLIHRYWKNGKSKLGTVPKYYNSGGKGKAKNLTSSLNGRQRIDFQPSFSN
jgi:hypothetical protein